MPLTRRARPRIQTRPHARCSRAGGTDIGILDVEHRPSEIYLSRIEICPGHQGRGIGTR